MNCGGIPSTRERSQSWPHEAIARQLVSFRIENGLSQAELARRCGVSRPAIARLERGEHEPKLATLRRVAHALDADLVLDISFRSKKRREHLAPLRRASYPPNLEALLSDQRSSALTAMAAALVDAYLDRADTPARLAHLEDDA